MARVLKQFTLPPSLLFPQGWSGTVPDLRRIQEALAGRVSLRNAFRSLPRWIAGVDVGLGRFAKIARAAAVLVDSRTLLPVAEAVVEQPVALPYIPGLLSFRELPVVLQALAQLPRRPDLLMCDGQGIAHPRRFGIAAHLGVATGLPSIGVAKSILVGTHDSLPGRQGAQRPLFIDGEGVGTVLRSRAGCAPLIVSPGHRIGIERAADFVMAMLTRYRLPEPTRLADRLSKPPRDTEHR
jgi:deoxyribonuclease V